ncbi:hypothetical protein ACI2VG_05805 [Ralstonia nicotianae]
MTVSILWRSEGRLHLASDSRMSFGAAGATDIGVKVMRLPIRIRGCDSDENGVLNTLFAATYGFAYAGSLSNAATFKQFIEDILLDVQYVDAFTPLSFELICEFLCRFSERISTEVVSRLAERGQYTFLLAGYCPSAGRLRGACFTLVQDGGRSVASFQEVAQGDGQYVSVGTGKTEFEKHIAGQPVSVQTVLLALNKVIDEEVVASVGGDIQYGSFRKNGDFAVSGITRISLEEADDGERHYGPSTERIFKYRGFEIYAGWTVDGDKFWPSPGFIELEVPSNKDSKERFIESCRALIAGGQ